MKVVQQLLASSYQLLAIAASCGVTIRDFDAR
jgi:hypothetical protein